MADLVLHGLGIAGYRSFGSAIQKFGPLSKVNALIGENNSGKSNALRFAFTTLQEVLANRYPAKERPPDDFLDKHQSAPTSAWSIAFAASPDQLRGRLEKSERGRLVAPEIRQLVDALTDPNDGLVWFTYKSADLKQAPTTLSLPPFEYKKGQPLSHDRWYRLWNALTTKESGDIDRHWIPETLRIFAESVRPAAACRALPAFRRIVSAGLENGSVVTSEDHSGRGLIERLSQIQSPTFTGLQSRTTFANITDFVRTVLGEPTATISVPHDKSMVIVHIRGRELPLDSFGTGLQELVVMAAYASLYHGQLICIEEPEIHLHPHLQKQLIRYLLDKTDNQYLLSSHSAHVINTPGITVFQLALDAAGATRVTRINTSAERRGACADLGYAPSDLLQTNCVIWAEGPSDRLYLNEWIRQADPALTEGIHYSVMFYGGTGSLSHMSAEDLPARELVAITALARRCCLLIDSDKDGPDADLGADKTRLKRELEAAGGYVWVTAGRELENYLDPAQLQAGVIAAHANAEALANRGQFTDNLVFKLRGQPKKRGNARKVWVAHKLVELGLPKGRYDFDQRLAELVAYIRASN